MERDWVVLNIDKQHMWATLAIKIPEGDECPIFSAEFIENYLKENGIRAGIQHAAIQALSEQAAYGTEVRVAEGKPAVNGQDGFYHFIVPMEDSKAKPAIREDGSVDYFNSLKLAMVEKDELIAIYNPATAGEYGYTIFSEMVPPVRGKELRPLRGSGFIVSEDNLEYRAAYDGRIIRNNDRITIDKVYQVKGDLDLERGNIRFNGDVEIRGDVRSGLTIESGGNIFVHGHVGACTLIATKDITIQKGVQGRNKCLIQAGNNVMCSFVERCSILADGNVYANSILDSMVLAKNQVILDNKSGMILGGIVTGVLGINVKNAGNAKEIPTTLQSGVLAEDTAEAARLNELLHSYDEKLSLLEKYLKQFDQIDGSKRTKETEALRMKTLRAKVVVVTDRKRTYEELTVINTRLAAARKSSDIHVKQLCHAGVIINISDAHFVMQEALKDVIFRLEHGEIVMVGAE